MVFDKTERCIRTSTYLGYGIFSSDIAALKVIPTALKGITDLAFALPNIGATAIKTCFIEVGDNGILPGVCLGNKLWGLAKNMASVLVSKATSCSSEDNSEFIAQVLLLFYAPKALNVKRGTATQHAIEVASRGTRGGSITLGGGGINIGGPAGGSGAGVAVMTAPIVIDASIAESLGVVIETAQAAAKAIFGTPTWATGLSLAVSGGSGSQGGSGSPDKIRASIPKKSTRGKRSHEHDPQLARGEGERSFRVDREGTNPLIVRFKRILSRLDQAEYNISAHHLGTALDDLDNLMDDLVSVAETNPQLANTLINLQEKFLERSGRWSRVLKPEQAQRVASIDQKIYQFLDEAPARFDRQAGREMAALAPQPTLADDALNLRRETRRVVSRLKPEEQEVLYKRVIHGETLDEVAQNLRAEPLTKSRVYQIQRRAFRKLRDPENTDGLLECIGGIKSTSRAKAPPVAPKPLEVTLLDDALSATPPKKNCCAPQT